MAAEAVGVPFREAIDFFARKVNLPTRRYDDLRHGAHVRAFTVAGVTRDDMLADFRAAMEKARTGGGFKAFQKDFDAIVERYGWKFYAKGDTEAKRRAWRADVIYSTNMRTSRMAGRYAQMTDPDVLAYRPFWRYVHSGSLHPRVRHLALDGKVFAASDPVWDVYFPPNGWGCDCDVVAMSKRDMEERGKSGPDEKPDWMVPTEGNDPKTGQIEQRWPGIDRGWEYNVGKEAKDGLVPAELARPLPRAGEVAEPLDLPDLPEPHPVAPDRIMPEGQPPERYADAFLSEFGATRDKPQFWRDKSGGIITVDKSLLQAPAMTDAGEAAPKSEMRGPYALLMADAIKDPDEIWVDWAKLAAGFVLRRTYIRRVVLPTGGIGVVRFEWTSKGWIGITLFPASQKEVRDLRTGALLFRRKPKASGR